MEEDCFKIRAKFGLSRDQAKDQSGWSTENKGIRERLWSLEVDRDDKT